VVKRLEELLERLIGQVEGLRSDLRAELSQAVDTLGLEIRGACAIPCHACEARATSRVTWQEARNPAPSSKAFCGRHRDALTGYLSSSGISYVVGAL
jgi:hypothetical protein